MRFYLGADPGQGGGYAIISEDLSDARAWRYPDDVFCLAADLKELPHEQIALAAIERVHAMPKQGVSSTFKFGQNYGGWLGILATLNIPVVTVTSRKWQKAMLDAGTGETTKDRSLAMARRLFPAVDLRFKVDNGKADALHLARWALEQHRGGQNGT